MKRLLRLAPFALLLPTVASASVVWKGDFETGNTSQWTRAQTVSSDRLLVVDSPVREGRYALKVTVHQGDDPINGSGNRNELVYMDHAEPGSEYFYKWSTLFPASFPSSPKWALFTQWHHDGEGGSPPLEFYVVNDEMRLRLQGDDNHIVWRAPLQREHWNDFVLHVKWSSDPNEGF
ncbi:MAG: polysaccharide lyase, partial [Archangium sp.]